MEAFSVAATPPERAKSLGEPAPPPKDEAKAAASSAARMRFSAGLLLATEAPAPKRTSILPDVPCRQPSADAAYASDMRRALSASRRATCVATAACVATVAAMSIAAAPHLCAARLRIVEGVNCV